MCVVCVVCVWCVLEDPGRVERSGRGGLFGPADAPGARGGRDEGGKCSFLFFFLFFFHYGVRKCYKDMMNRL